MSKNTEATHDIGALLTHKSVVSGNVGFTFRAVNNQGFYLTLSAYFNMRREAGATKPGNTSLKNAINDCLLTQLFEVIDWMLFSPGVLTIGLNKDCRFFYAGRM